MNTITLTDTIIKDKILTLLDNWELQKEPIETEPSIDDRDDLAQTVKGNTHETSTEEVERFYNESLTFCQGRLKTRDLTTLDTVKFNITMEAVYNLTASSLFAKYNTTVYNNEEGTYEESRAKVLRNNAYRLLGLISGPSVTGYNSIIQG